LSEWLQNHGKSLAQTAEYIGVGVLAIGLAAAAVALLPVEGAAAVVVVLVVAGTANAGNSRPRKKDTMT
jgi:hypothetical protein